MPLWTPCRISLGRRRSGLALWAALALLLPSCQGYGFTLLGYTTDPQYDCNIHTVNVPIFKNLTFYRGLEEELTQAVVREIEAKTPYKVVSDPSRADTQLTGTIVTMTKNVINRNQENEIREGQTVLGVEVVWRDLRSGEILSRPRPPGVSTAIPAMAPLTVPPGGEPAIAPVAPPPPPGAPPGPPPPVLIQSTGDYIPEIGGSLATAEQQNVDHLAIQIVSMMEKAW